MSSRKTIPQTGELGTLGKTYAELTRLNTQIEAFIDEQRRINDGQMRFNENTLNALQGERGLAPRVAVMEGDVRDSILAMRGTTQNIESLLRDMAMLTSSVQALAGRVKAVEDQARVAETAAVDLRDHLSPNNAQHKTLAVSFNASPVRFLTNSLIILLVILFLAEAGVIGRLVELLRLIP